MNKRKFFSIILSSTILFSCKGKQEETSTFFSINSNNSTQEIESSIDSTLKLEQYDFFNLDYSNNKKIINSFKNKLSVKINNNEDYTSLNNECEYKDEFLANDNDLNLDEFNCYDLSIPNNITKENIKDKYNVVLFIHPGGWISGSKDDLSYDGISITSLLSGNYNSSSTSSMLINAIKSTIRNRYITISMNYTLMVQKTGHKELSVYRMIDEVEACLNHAISKLIDIGFDKDNLSLILSGGSAGSYLALLYSYLKGKEAIIKPSAIINVVGPVSLNYLAWREFIDQDKKDNGSSILPNDIDISQTQPLSLENTSFTYINRFTQFQTMKFLNGLAGSIYSEEELYPLKNDDETVKEDEKSNLLLKEIEDSLSPITYLNSSSTPTFSFYGGRDQIIGINQYATLKPILDKYNVKNQLHFEKNFTHYLGLDNIESVTDLISLLNVYQTFAKEVRSFFKELDLL